MTALQIQNLADMFWLNQWVVRSWCENWWIKEQKKAEALFREHEKIIKAKPFVKWVGGKRQLIKQFESLFPKEFNDYFEPFVGGGVVYQR